MSKYSLFVFLTVIIGNFATPVAQRGNNKSLKIPFRSVRIPLKANATGTVVRRTLWPRMFSEGTAEGDDNNNPSGSISSTMQMRVGTIGIGTPPQMFQMLMSSECAEFWVYASEEFEADQWGQNSKHWYNISGSSSVDAKTNDKIEFDEENRGISVASGYVVNEKILIGDNSISNVEIGAITRVSYMFRVGDFQIPVDGKLGLSLDRAAGWGARKLASPMFGLVAKAEKPILTLFQKRTSYGWEEPFFEGSLTIGTENSDDCVLSNFKPLKYFVKWDGEFGGQPRLSIKSMHIVEGSSRNSTLTDVDILPREVVIVEGLGIQLSTEEAIRVGHYLAPFGVRRIQPGFFQIPCENRGKLPTVSLQLADHPVAKQESAMTVKLNFNELVVNYRKKLCILLIEGSPSPASLSTDPVLIGNGMIQQGCMKINPVEKTIAFASAAA